MKPAQIVFTITVLIVFPLIHTSPAGVHAQPIDNPLVTLYVGGTGPNNYSTIQQALNDAQDYYHIYVYAVGSPYYENIIINKKITLIGENSATTTILPNNTTDVVKIQEDQVYLHGFTITNSSSIQPQVAVNIINSGNITISDMRFQNIQEFGIKTTGQTQNISLTTNIFENINYGVYIQQSTNSRIVSTEFTDNNEGIYLVDSENIFILDNMFRRNSVGIHLEKITEMTMEYNIFTENDEGSYCFQTTNSTVRNNIFRYNRWVGLWTMQSASNSIHNNEFIGNIDIGLYIEYSINNEIYENQFIENDDGIYLEFSEENQVHHNDFYNLKFNIFFVAGSIQQVSNSIYNNFYDRPRLLPYLIFGTIKQNDQIFSWITFDFRPLKKMVFNTITLQEQYGDIYYVGGSGAGNYSTIQEAVNIANHGDTIYVFEGIYYESVQIDKSLSVIGENQETTIIDGSGRDDLFQLMSEGILIEGFTFRNGHFGVYIIKTTGHIIQNNRFIGTLHAISIHCGEDILIKNNNFDENPYGIRLYYCQDITVTENQFSSLKLDVFFIGSTLGECKHMWNRNYWGKPRSLPVLIRGKFLGESLTFFIFNIDWFPLRQIEVS